MVDDYPDYTEKLEFPIPAATRAGDANDVEQISETMGELLSIIDRAAGDYVSLAVQTAHADTKIPHFVNMATDGRSFSDLLGEVEIGAAPGTPNPDREGYLVATVGDKATWPASSESEFIKVNTNGLIEMKRAGNLQLHIGIGVYDNSEPGEIMVGIKRSDSNLQGMPDAGYFVFLPWRKSIKINDGSLTTNTDMVGTVSATIPPSFYPAGATLEIFVGYFNMGEDPEGTELSIQGLNLTIERL